MIKAKCTCLLYFTFLFLILGCEKESDPYEPAFVEGVVLDQVSGLPIPYAKLTLFELEAGLPTRFIFWDSIDIQTAGPDGTYRFDYQGDRSNLYGLKAEHDKYYNLPEIDNKFRQHRTEIDVYAIPKSYLRIRMFDEPPLRTFDSIWILSTTFAPTTKILTPFTDTTVIAPTTANESEVISWVFWNEGERTNLGGFNFCPAHDTCSVMFTF